MHHLRTGHHPAVQAPEAEAKVGQLVPEARGCYKSRRSALESKLVFLIEQWAPLDIARLEDRHAQDKALAL